MSIARKIDIDRALCDEKLLGAALGDPDTWLTWRAVLKATFGLELDDDEVERFAGVSGGREPPVNRVSELWAIAGRRSGKSRMAAALATYLAAFVDWTKKLAPGEPGFVLTLSPTIAQAELITEYCRAFLEESPILRRKVIASNKKEIRLDGNITIAAHPNSFRSTRGRTLLAAIMDEAAFYRDETSAIPDIESYRALVPSLATTRGLLIGISSPYRKMGLLYNKHRESFGKDDPDVLVVQGASTKFNPTIDSRVIDRAKESDPEAALAEWDAEFRQDISGLFDERAIDSSINRERPLELTRGRNTYFCFLDASGGRHDHFTCCIGYREGMRETARFVTAVLRGAKPPLDPHEVTHHFVQLAKRYGVQKIYGDNYSAEWLAQAVKDAGASYEVCELPKSKLYLEAVPHFSRAAIEIPDIPILIRELKLLERRLQPSGREAVDHPTGGSDDYANALVGCMYFAMRKHWDPSYSWAVEDRPDPYPEEKRYIEKGYQRRPADECPQRRPVEMVELKPNPNVTWSSDWKKRS